MQALFEVLLDMVVDLMASIINAFRKERKK